MDQSKRKLAELLRARMDELGWTQTTLSDETKRIDETGRGISHRTISNMMTGARDAYSGRSCRLVERVLHWPAGTIPAVLAGEDVDLPDDIGEVVNAELDAVRAEVAELRTQVERLTSLLRAV